MQEKKFKVVQRDIVGQFVSNTCVSSTDIQESMDSLGVSRKGYAALQKSISKALGSNRIKHNFLPNPTTVWNCRQELNVAQLEHFGTPFHITEEYVSEQGSMVYDEFNNLFMDLELLQKRMVEFYDMTLQECSGTLHFVLKMDECEVLKQRKLERVTITLMNRAMSNMERTDSKYFSVQSETNVWWLGAFQVLVISFIQFSVLYRLLLTSCVCVG